MATDHHSWLHRWLEITKSVSCCMPTWCLTVTVGICQNYHCYQSCIYFDLHLQPHCWIWHSNFTQGCQRSWLRVWGCSTCLAVLHEVWHFSSFHHSSLSSSPVHLFSSFPPLTHCLSYSLSYVTATYVVEAMAAANAYQKHLDESEDNQILYSTEEDGTEAIDEKVHTRLVSLDTTCMCEHEFLANPWLFS